MPPSVVQSAAVGSGSSLTLTNPVTGGNSLAIIAQGYNTSSSSSPTYNGSTPIGAALLAQLNSAVENVYSGIWLLPNLAGGSKSVGITISGGDNGFTVAELAGLGAAPQLDPNGGYSLNYGGNSATGMPSGNMPALASSSAILLGTGAAYGDSSYTPPGGWTTLPAASFSIAQFQIITGAGGVYEYDPTGTGDGWGSLIVAITAAPVSGSTRRVLTAGII
jgi:hypothetical protein